MQELRCFSANDIRGRLGIDLDEAIVGRIGRAFAQVLGARRVVVGRDCRASSPALSTALVAALISEGVEVLDLGLAGTEEMYWATTHLDADGGIEITASHNPMNYNGMKMVARGSAPLDRESQLFQIKKLAETNAFGRSVSGGSHRSVSDAARASYVGAVLSFVDLAKLRPLTIVVNSGNGAAGPTFDAIAKALCDLGAPLTFLRMNHAPDASFPNGIPNPLLPENRKPTSLAVQAAKADLGIAFDGDFDRCFFFDSNGAFVDGEFIVGLLAQTFLAKESGATIVNDPRVIWNIQDVVLRGKGRAVLSRTGHAYMKHALRTHKAVYGGEMSAHHYFRDFMSCDSGMIPWLLIVELMGRTGQSLAQMLAGPRNAFPSSGEINFNPENPSAALARVRAAYMPFAEGIDDIDGLSMHFGTWRFNLRASNTETVVRLNVESRGDARAVLEKTKEISDFLNSESTFLEGRS